MTIDHICFAVNDLKAGIKYWEDVFGYKQITRIIENSRQMVKVTFLAKQGSLTVKLIEPIESNQALFNYVKSGGGFHHVCFKCKDISQSMAELNGKGLLTLAPIQPGEAFANHDIAFMLARYGLRIELIDTDERSGKIEQG